MQCDRIEVVNFRNIEGAKVSFSSKTNLLLGNNAQGKTNLLEAISLMALGKSFRGAREADMIRFGQTFSTVTLDYTDDVRSMQLVTRMEVGKRRKLEQNGLPVKSLSELVGGLRVVLFCPEHLSLIKSGPELRRNFLDVALSQLRPLYLSSLQRYNKTLKERNKLLKEAAEDEKARRIMQDTIDVWSYQLAKEGAVLSRYRARYVALMQRAVADVFSDMTGGKETPALRYRGCLGDDPAFEYAETDKVAEYLYQKLSCAHEREMGAGCTLWGAHRDDIEIDLNGAPARLFASQGQQRSLALAMKLAEGEISRETFCDYPVFLFDDVQSELDPRRRDYLLHRLGGKQVIMTSCEESGILDDAHVIRVEGGKFEQ